jgi:hypothetical protein
MALKMLALCEDLTVTERRVGAALLDHRNHRTGRCDPGLDTLSRELGINRRTVIRASAALEKRGLVASIGMAVIFIAMAMTSFGNGFGICTPLGCDIVRVSDENMPRKICHLVGARRITLRVAPRPPKPV